MKTLSNSGEEKMKTLKQQAKTPKQIWTINSETNIENSLWVSLEDIKEWLQEHKENHYLCFNEDGLITTTCDIIKELIEETEQ